MPRHESAFLEAVKAGETSEVQRFLEADPVLAAARDADGATPLHYAALHGHREMVKLLISNGADVNATDGRFQATPAGWAIEYLRERGGMLAIELEDLAFAIGRQDKLWVERILRRFPHLKSARDAQGVLFQEHAERSGNRDIRMLFQQNDEPPASFPDTT